MRHKNHSWLHRLWALSKRSGGEREIEEELHAHLEMRIADNLAAGMDAQTAERNARIRFGNVTATREHVAAIDTALGVQSVWRDVMYAFRSFRINAAFSAVAIVTLALGIGANAGIYTVLNAVLLKSLPVDKPEQLRLLKISGDAAEHARFSYLILDRMRAALPASASLSMMSWPSGFNVKLGRRRSGPADRPARLRRFLFHSSDSSSSWPSVDSRGRPSGEWLRRRPELRLLE